MPIEAVVNLEIRNRIDQMLAYQREDPLQVRIVTPKIRDVVLCEDGKTIYNKIQKLKVHREAEVTLIINPSWMIEEEDKKLLKNLDALGVKIHSNTNLHAKLLLVENEKEKLALVGSANFTKGGLMGHDEASAYFVKEQDQVYDKLYSYVTRMLQRANDYIGGADTTPRRGHIEKRIEGLQRKIVKLNQELLELGND